MCVIGHHSSYISLRVTRQKKRSLYCLFLTATLGCVKINSNFPVGRSSRIFSSNVPSTSSPQTRKLVQLTPTDLSLFIWSSIKAFKGETTITIDLSFDERSLAVILSVMKVAFGRSTTSRNQLEELLNNPDR